MSDLTPQVRPDKHGKMVTRHVRAVPVVATKPLPSPVLVDRTQEDEVFARTKEALSAIFDGGRSPDDLAIKNVEYMATFEPEMLSRVTSQAASSHNMSRLWGHTINGIVASATFRKHNGHKTFNRNLIVFPLAADLIPARAHGNNPGLVQDYTREVRDMTVMLMDDSGEFDSPEMLKALTIIGVVRKRYTGRGLDVGWNQSLRFADIAPEAQFIANNIDRVEPLAAELVQRESYDIELIEALMSAPAALVEGQL